MDAQHFWFSLCIFAGHMWDFPFFCRLFSTHWLDKMRAAWWIQGVILIQE